jgi:hypothetical protein
MKRVCLFAITSLGVAALVACGGSGAATSPTTPASPTAPSASVTAITVTSAAASSATMQLTATARLSDGTTRDVTTASQWTSSNPAVATISAVGLLTVVASGDLEARATYQGVTGSMHLTVARTQRFAVSGVAHEVSPDSRLLAGVQVTITDGPDAGQSVVTDANGRFRFAALSAGVVAVEANKGGYDAWKVANLTIDGDRQLDVVLYPVPPTDPSGKPATARCNDGSWSWDDKFANACTDHLGVAYTVCPGPLCGALK